MAKVVLSGLDAGSAMQIGQVLGSGAHEISHLPDSAPAHSCLDADIVFAGSHKDTYLPLLREVRKARPELPFVVVSRLPETTEWLDALEAGATDYCVTPLDQRQLGWLFESILPARRASAAAA